MLILRADDVRTTPLANPTKAAPSVMLARQLGSENIQVSYGFWGRDPKSEAILSVGFSRACSFSWDTVGNDADPVHASWVSLNAKSAGERSVTTAIFIIAANTFGVISS